MNKTIILIVIALFFSIKNQAQKSTDLSIILIEQTAEKVSNQNIYQFKVKDLNGKEFDFATLKGKKVLIVNTASECIHTHQYKDLQKLYKKYGKQNNFVVVGFPTNDFGAQEPGTDKEIKQFTAKKYGITFPMMNKTEVLGKDMDKVYQFLTQKSKNDFQDSEVIWNFQKYLINEKGELEKIVTPKILPNDKIITDWILNKN